VAGAVILGAALTAAGAVISKLDAAILANGAPMTAAARVYADYLFARDLPLAAGLLFLLALQARRMLAGLMVLTALIQIVDVLNDLGRGDLVLIPGLLLFAIVFLIGARRLFGRPIWQIAAWREPQTGWPESR
jgi:hypothetical protein